MPFWSSQRLKLEHSRHSIIEPFNPKNVKQGAYELTLSREVIKTAGFNEQPSAQPAADEGFFIIPSGAFALLYTQEEVIIPSNVLAFISIKASKKLDGLINISGFHVDPTFKGRLKFSVYNAGPSPIFLDFHQPTFLIWFAEMDQETDVPYNGAHLNQNKISETDRQRMALPSVSPASLDERLKRLELHQSVAIWCLGIVLVPTFIAVVACLMNISWELLKKLLSH
jgi:dCTP deaminase